MGSEDEKAIEAAFLESWDRIVEFFADTFGGQPLWAWLMPILDLIAELRVRGYDRHFRAGQSLDSFVLSRSRQHGLRLDQPYLRIYLYPEGGMQIAYDEPPDTYIENKMENVEVTPEVEDLLQRLLSHPID